MSAGITNHIYHLFHIQDESTKWKMVQTFGEEGLERTRQQEKRDPPKSISLKSEPSTNLLPKADLPKADPSRKADPPDIFKGDSGNKISQKTKKFAEKTYSALETNGVLYQKVCLPMNPYSIYTIYPLPIYNTLNPKIKQSNFFYKIANETC